MNIEVMNTNQINFWSSRSQENAKKELKSLYIQAFPKLPENQSQLFVEDYFKRPNGCLTRQVFLFRNKIGTLIAAAVFDHGTINCDGPPMKGIYSITRAVLPERQGSGLGKIIAAKIFEDYEPDVLFTTCAQSASLYSWIGLCEKGVIKGYEIYPRLEKKNDGQELITFPHKDMDFAINAFKQVYMGVAEGNKESINDSIRSLTLQMVRKNTYTSLYDHDPWKKKGREDMLAKILGLTHRDGVLVVAIKIGPSCKDM